MVSSVTFAWYFAMFSVSYFKGLSRNLVKYGALYGVLGHVCLVKYGAPGAFRVSWVTFTRFFIVSAAFYVESWSENRVKNTGSAARAQMDSRTVACVLRCLRHFMLSHVQKTV